MKNKNTENPEQVLLFFNNVTDHQEILDQIKDDPKFGNPSKRTRMSTKKLAQRILDTRSKLPKKQFQSLEQIDAIRGIGKDTIQDITYSVGKRIPSDTNPPMKLDDIVSGISSALVNVKNQIDTASMESVKKYQKNEKMPSLSPSFFSISDVKINLRFTVQKASPKIEDTLVSVNTEYLKQLPKSMISEISLDLIPKKKFKRKGTLSSNKINKIKQH